ncbi:Diaminopropionate ammonia-lyase [Ascidiaceihabitans donghaensis]|uniref:Diaminopropionate ammonia-lyase n=1 Tax=Ascidiaceihabitans donghaensis TaxID=1510460 RepID=A0A2R8BGI9_9RHOB|nr:pyridoxal-phosphate dependent enzyme [Ascidiaceihabitans donghaensis]SPH22180.1 Diaminopropionate ammonia-lyase [Ascidiaceihabitans donghaensis]
MDILLNTPRRSVSGLDAIPTPSTDVEAVQSLLDKCPHAAQTPLLDAHELAAQAGVQNLWLKDERSRMGLGSFKALGAAYVIAHDAAGADVSNNTYVTASAGNHGMSVAAGADAFGANAVVYIAQSVPESFAERLRSIGAEVRREGDIYEDSMAAAAKAAKDNDWILLSDSSWPGYTDRPFRVMEGYLVLMAEAIAQMPQAPTHIFLQAGVGGLAGACAAMARKTWGDDPVIVVVEPDQAPALVASIKAGAFVVTLGGVSDMGRLDCKEASLIALKGLSRDADAFVTLTEQEGAEGAQATVQNGIAASASGAAGIAALLQADAHRDALKLDAASRVFCILSEGPA